MPLGRGGTVGACVELTSCIFAHTFEHSKPRLSARVVNGYQRLVDEGREQIQDLELVNFIVSCGGLDRLERETSGKHGTSPKEFLLGVGRRLWLQSMVA